MQILLAQTIALAGCGQNGCLGGRSLKLCEQCNKDVIGALARAANARSRREPDNEP